MSREQMAQPGVGLRLAIVGGGFAGWAACHAAKARGLRPIWLSHGPGASEQSCGAGDSKPWDERDSIEQIREEVAELLNTWGIFRVQADYVATSAGVVRRAAAVGRGVLGLQAFRGGTVGVLDLGRANFPAAALASALQAESWALESQTRFVSVRMEGAFPPGFSSVPLGAIGTFLDQPEARARFSESLRAITSELTGISALLCEPLLGLEPEKIASPLPLGETLSPPEGAFGYRVAAAREQWRAANGLELCAERVESVSVQDGAVRVVSRAGSGESSTRWVDAAIIATGGLVGGGIGLIPQPSGELGERLGNLLWGASALPSGDWDGWDAQADAVAWTSPHSMTRKSKIHVAPLKTTGARILVVGDARSTDWDAKGPVGTVLGSVDSALKAVAQLLSDC